MPLFLVFVSIYAIIDLGLNLQWGFTGLFNVGVAGLVATGAYTSALFTASLGLPVPLGMIAAVMLTGLVGFLAGALTLRLRRDYLAITTFGVAVMIQALAHNFVASPAAPSACSSYQSPCNLGSAPALGGTSPILCSL